ARTTGSPPSCVCSPQASQSPSSARATTSARSSARRASWRPRVPDLRVPLICLVPGLVLVLSWLRLEHPQQDGWRALALLLLAVAPAAAPRVWQRLVLLGVATLAAIAAATRVPWHHPWRAASRLWDGFLDAYDVKLPFDPVFHAH